MTVLVKSRSDRKTIVIARKIDGQTTKSPTGKEIPLPAGAPPIATIQGQMREIGRKKVSGKVCGQDRGYRPSYQKVEPTIMRNWGSSTVNGAC